MGCNQSTERKPEPWDSMSALRSEFLARGLSKKTIFSHKEYIEHFETCLKEWGFATTKMTETHMQVKDSSGKVVLADFEVKENCVVVSIYCLRQNMMWSRIETKAQRLAYEVVREDIQCIELPKGVFSHIQLC